MYELTKKIGKVLTSKFVGTGPSSYEKWTYRAAVSQRLRNTALDRTATEIDFWVPYKYKFVVPTYAYSWILQMGV